MISEYIIVGTYRDDSRRRFIFNAMIIPSYEEAVAQIEALKGQFGTNINYELMRVMP